MEKADLLLQNVLVYNSVFRQFYPADVYILRGKIFYIDLKKEGLIPASCTIDAQGRYMAPGLVDIHMHIESSMMTPSSMAKRLAQCGVTTVVSEPHEMANVKGLDGILDMMEAGKDAPIDIYYGIPSCVPATSPDLETTGGVIDLDSMKSLLDNPQVVCVGEVMNYRQIIRENDLEIGKLLEYLSSAAPRYTIEGHCPSLLDVDLAKFIFLGIDSDHTEHSLEELKQRFFNGMFIEIQEKMLNREVLSFIEENELYGHFGFVTDDVMADTLREQGHLDAVLRKAIALGMTPEQAIYHATYTNAMRMKFTDRTMLSPGKLADFILLDDLKEFHIHATYKNGTCIYQEGEPQRLDDYTHHFPDSYCHTVRLHPVTQQAFTVHVEDAAATEALVEVMVISDGSTKTRREQVWLPVRDGEVQWEDTPYLLAVVLERYGKSLNADNIGYGFITGDALKCGAAATTYAHDHHNLLAAGSNKADLELAVNTVIVNQGGITVTSQGEVTASLKLDIGGILSGATADCIGVDLKKVREALEKQGYKHYNPIMSFCTLSLLASPALKLSDKGLIDVAEGEIIPVVREVRRDHK